MMTLLDEAVISHRHWILQWIEIFSMDGQYRHWNQYQLHRKGLLTDFKVCRQHRPKSKTPPKSRTNQKAVGGRISMVSIP